MKNYLILLIVLFVSGCSANNNLWIRSLDEMALSDSIANNTQLKIYLKYKQPLNGYEITARWMPSDSYAETGHIMVNFRHTSSGKTFQYIDDLYHNFDIDKIISSPGFEGYQNGNIYYLDYITKNPETYKDSPFAYYMPFQFYDVDFDGKDELIINECDLLKGGNSYQAYKINDNSIQLMDSLPFNRLNNDVEFDIENKSIRLYGIDGIFDNSLVVFSKHSTTIRNKVVPLNLSETTGGNILEEYYKQDKTNFRLDSIYQYFNQELGYTYIIIDDELTLVEQTIIAN